MSAAKLVTRRHVVDTVTVTAANGAPEQFTLADLRAIVAAARNLPPTAVVRGHGAVALLGASDRVGLAGLEVVNVEREPLVCPPRAPYDPPTLEMRIDRTAAQ